MPVAITWNGHSNFMLEEGGVKVLIDPYFEDNPAAPYGWEALGSMDLVLVTHDHHDHTGQAVEICRNTGAMLGCIVGTAEKLVQRGVPEKQVVNGIGFNIGGTVEVKGVRVTMTEAFHSSDSGFPVGYIVRMPGGLTVYHAGDTGVFANMKVWGGLFAIDVALLPIGGVFTMDARQAAMAAALLGARRAAPMHYGTFPLLERNSDCFVAELARHAPDCEPVILKPGESINLRPGTSV